MWYEFLLVFVLAMLSGGWATGAGIVFGIDPWVVYFAAVAGSISFTLVFLWAGTRFKDALLNRFYPEAESKISSSKAGEIVGKWGEIGLALLGTTLLGPTLTLVSALVLNVDMRRFRLWYVIGTFTGFAVFTLFWVAVAG